METTGAWEDVAAELLDRLDLSPPIDPFDVVARMELDIRECSRATRPCIVAGVIMVPEGQRRERLGFSCLHEIGHVVGAEHGDSSEDAANAIAGCLLLPRLEYSRDMKATRWALPALKERHPHASFEVLARRIMSLREVVLVVADRAPERRSYRLRSSGMGSRCARPLPIERELVEAADESGEAQGPHDLVRAWPIVDGAARRVVLVGEVEALEMASGF